MNAKTIAKIDLIGRAIFMIPIIILAAAGHILFTISITILHWVLGGNPIANDIMCKIDEKSE